MLVPISPGTTGKRWHAPPGAHEPSACSLPHDASNFCHAASPMSGDLVTELP